MRCPGDIDVWINTDEQTAYNYVKILFSDEKETYKHIHFPLFNEVSVDVHVTPLKFYSGLYLKRLKQWFEQNEADQFENTRRLPETDRDICVPTSSFNIVYQLGLMLIHLFDEGLGMRQVVDYFYVLKSMDISELERLEIADTIRNLGMFRFARSIMWIECNVCGLPADKCYVSPDERLGKELLTDILEGGNFGHHSQRYKGNKGFYMIGLIKAWRNINLLSMAPREGIARVFSRIRTAFKQIFVNINLKNIISINNAIV